MTAKQPKSDEERQVLADENADIAFALANAMQPRGTDGRNLHDRIRAELAGTIGGTGFEAHVSGGSTTWCDVHEDDHCDEDGGGCPEQYLVPVRPDRTGNAAVTLTQHPDRAAAALKDWDAATYSVRMGLLRLQRIAVEFMPRPARSSEQLLTAAEEDRADPGCESCRRCTRPDGGLYWVATHRTSDVRTAPGKDPETARLAKVCRLCKGCYEEVMLLPPGAKLTMAQALPLKRVRYRLTHGKRARIHEYELQDNVQEKAS